MAILTRRVGRLGLLGCFGLIVCGAHAASAPAQRIVSLAPNLTELVYAAGAGDRMVGADEYSDFPAAARLLPRVGDAFQVDYERVLALHPDLVLVWGTGTPEPVIETLKRLKLPVERITTSRLEDVSTALRRIGSLAGTEATADRAAVEFTAAVASLRQLHAGDTAVAVFFQISAAPLFTINGQHLISDVLGICGGQNVFANLAQLAPPISIEAVLERNPEVIIAGDDSGAGSDPLARWRKWPDLTAVRHRNLFLVSADRIARPTTRIVDGAREVCDILAVARDRLQQEPIPQ